MSICIVCKVKYLKSNFKKYCSKDCYFIRNKSIPSGSIISPCLFCSKDVLKSKCELKNNNVFCNNACSMSYFQKNKIRISTQVEVICKFCEKCFLRPRHMAVNLQTNISKNNFCSVQCSGKYLGSQSKNFERSSLELYIHEKIKSNFPYVNLVVSDRNQCAGLELDFYFPDLNLGIEINGPMHYIPYFGTDYLNSVQNRDIRKVEICKIKNIDLLTVKSISKFKINQAEIFWKTEIKPKLMSLIPFCEPYTEEQINFIKPLRKQIGKCHSNPIQPNTDISSD